MSEKEFAIISIYSPKATLHGSWASGVWSYTKNLLTYMDREIRKKIVVLTEYSEKNPKEVYEEDEMIIDRCWERRGIFSWIKQILTTLKKYPQIKTIHIQHEFNMFGSTVTIPLFLMLLLFLRKYKLIVTYHGVVDIEIIDKEYGKINALPSLFPPLFLKFSFWFFYKVSSWFIDTAVVHEDYFKKVLKKYGFWDKQVVVIPHGVEDLSLSITKQEARNQLNIPQDKKVILYFWFLAGYKGVDLLLDWFENLDPNEYSLILAGGAPKRTLKDTSFKKWYDMIDQRAKTMPWVIRIWWFIPDEMIPVIYAASDLLIMPYLYMLAASGPMALALAYGLPFLVSEVFSPVIINKSMRFDKTPSDLAKKVEAWCQNPHMLESLILELRAERLWGIVSEKTVLLYR